MAKTTGYEPKIALRVLERLADGELLVDICHADDPTTPSRVTFLKWCSNYPELQRAYTAAREMSAIAFEEDSIKLARELVNKGELANIDNEGKPVYRAPSKEHIAAVKVAIDQYQWSASKRFPREFGTHGVDQDKGILIQINTSLPLPGAQNNNEGLGMAGGFVIDVEVPDAPSDTPSHPEGTPAARVATLDPTNYGTGALSETRPGLAAPPPGDWLGRKPPGRPKGRKQGPQKTAKQIAATKVAYARRGKPRKERSDGTRPEPSIDAGQHDPEFPSE